MMVEVTYGVDLRSECVHGGFRGPPAASILLVERFQLLVGLQSSQRDRSVLLQLFDL